jgi:hypothetical protein
VEGLRRIVNNIIAHAGLMLPDYGQALIHVSDRPTIERPIVLIQPEMMEPQESSLSASTEVPNSHDDDTRLL